MTLIFQALKLHMDSKQKQREGDIGRYIYGKCVFLSIYLVFIVLMCVDMRTPFSGVFVCVRAQGMKTVGWTARW